MRVVKNKIIIKKAKEWLKRENANIMVMHGREEEMPILWLQYLRSLVRKGDYLINYYKWVYEERKSLLYFYFILFLHFQSLKCNEMI